MCRYKILSNYDWIFTLLTASRPEIIFSVCVCARFQSCPKESHLHAIKRTFKYLLETINLGLCIVQMLSLNG